MELIDAVLSSIELIGAKSRRWRPSAAARLRLERCGAGWSCWALGWRPLSANWTDCLSAAPSLPPPPFFANRLVYTAARASELTTLPLASGPRRGLKNVGNTCYINAALQCMAATTPLAEGLRRVQTVDTATEVRGA